MELQQKRRAKEPKETFAPDCTMTKKNAGRVAGIVEDTRLCITSNRAMVPRKERASIILESSVVLLEWILARDSWAKH